MGHPGLLTVEDTHVRQLAVSAHEVLESAATHPYAGALPLTYTLDRDGDLFAVDREGWHGDFMERRYVRPLTPLLQTIAAIVAEHGRDGGPAQSGRFFLHCGWVECAICHAPLAWLAEPARAIGADAGAPTACPRRDCFCGARPVW